MSARSIIEDLFSQADIKINGNRPWDPIVHNPGVFARVLSEGSLGLGESYMDKWWDVESLDQFVHKMLTGSIDKKVSKGEALFNILYAHFVNLQSKARAFEVGQKHYDVGNDLYEAMLDKRMTYTCGYFKKAKTLDAAQTAKLDLICKKLHLKGGERILDIGCGWGSFALFAAEKYGASVVGLTVSKEQVALGQEKAKGLPVEFRLQDYRDLPKEEKFDRVVSVGMFEHVGVKNYPVFMEVAHRALKDDGLFLLHSIGANISLAVGDAWLDKYIFPNGMLPSVAQIGKSIEDLFIMEDWHNFGPYYDKTLMAWFRNFDKAWPKLKDKYDERFYRMWKYYLLLCAGTFRARYTQLWQIVLSKKGVAGGYESVR